MALPNKVVFKRWVFNSAASHRLNLFFFFFFFLRPELCMYSLEAEEAKLCGCHGNAGSSVCALAGLVKVCARTEEERAELRPRLCVIQRGSNGYGFNLHSERARPGQYIRAVDDDSPAERAGLQPKDRIVEVNSVSVEGKTHSEVVGAIKAGGDVTRLLVVDPDTDAFFKRCRVTPTLEHLTGPLPEPVINGETEEKVNGRVPKESERERNSKLSVSPSPSNASSNASLTTPSAHTPPEGLVTNAIPGLNLTLQQVKELTHQKRSNKRAPPMDWTKKNELFSNL